MVNAAAILPWTAFFATIAGWWANSWFAARREQRSEIRRAKAEFRATVLAAFKDFYPQATMSNADYASAVEKNFPEIQRGVETLRSYLPDHASKELDKAWRWLCVGDWQHPGDRLLPHHLMRFQGIDPDKNFRDGVAKLLAPASPDKTRQWRL